MPPPSGSGGPSGGDALTLRRMTIGTPEAEVEIDADLVRALLGQQHPQLAALPLEPVDAGWDNAMFRLGESLCVRLPRRELAARLIVHEQTWLPRLARRLPVDLPEPRHVGRPGRGYPWHWSIVPWLSGATADRTPLPASQAGPLARFLAALHMPAPAEAPTNTFRGVPLQARASGVEARLRRLRASTPAITEAVEATFGRALSASPATTARWLHGDLHPRNVLVEQGRLAAVIDWGDVTGGDVATDLAGIWMLLADARARREALATYFAAQGVSGAEARATVDRARGWAVLFGVVMLDSGLVDHPAHAAIGAATLERVGADAR